MLADLPATLRALPPRTVTPKAGPFVVAWGDPAVVLRCGVAKPVDFGPGSSAQLIQGGSDAGANYFVSHDGSSEVFTAVDRKAFVSISIPTKYQGSDYLTPLNAAVLKAMPTQVCSTDPATPNPDTLCDRRP